MCRPMLTRLPGSATGNQQLQPSKTEPTASPCSSWDVDFSSEDYDDRLNELLNCSSWQSRCSETAALQAAGSRFASQRPLPALRAAHPPAEPDGSESAVMSILTAALQHQQLNADNNSAAAATAAAAAAIGADSLYGILSIPLPFDMCPNPPVRRCLFDSSAPALACNAGDSALNYEAEAAAACNNSKRTARQVSSACGDTDQQVQSWLATLETHPSRKRGRHSNPSTAEDSAAAAVAEPYGSPGSPCSSLLPQGMPPPAFMMLSLLGRPADFPDQP